MNQNKAVDGYTKAIWTGVTTIELARAVSVALNDGLTGLYHLVNGKTIDKCSLLKLFNDMRAEPVKIQAVDNVPVDKSLICTRNDFVYQVPTYQEMVREVHCWILEHPEMYSNYRIKMMKKSTKE